MPNYYQIAAGSSGRDYADDFFRYGLAFVGDEKHIATLRSLVPGDFLVLKQGVRAISAVGEVVSRNGVHFGDAKIYPKKWLRDYDGWDLPGYCCVDWRIPSSPLPTVGLVRGTLKGVNQASVISAAQQVWASSPRASPPALEPADVEKICDERIIKHLISCGKSVRVVEDLILAFTRIRRLAHYYYHCCRWETVREHETRTFLVVPLLLALGWAEQEIKIEYPLHGRGRVDVALLHDSYNGWKNADANCVSLVETKGFSQGLTYVYQQARNYAAKLPKCRVVFVSNGFCYKAYERDGTGVFAQKPTAYLNILDPRSAYPLDPSVPGCIRALELLMNWP